MCIFSTLSPGPWKKYLPGLLANKKKVPKISIREYVNKIYLGEFSFYFGKQKGPKNLQALYK